MARRDTVTPDLFGADEARGRLDQERKASRRIDTENRKRMTRRKDRPTSIAAASGVKLKTIREQVVAFATSVGPTGFTDDELKQRFSAAGPESSYRKRRTELAQDGVLMDSTKERRNRHGRAETVWVLRAHAGPDARRVYPGPRRDDRLRRAAQALLDAVDCHAREIAEPIFADERKALRETLG